MLCLTSCDKWSPTCIELAFMLGAPIDHLRELHDLAVKLLDLNYKVIAIKKTIQIRTDRSRSGFCIM